MNTIPRLPAKRAALAAALATAFAGLASAQENVFTTSALATQWANNANWSLGAFPNSVGAIAVFNSPDGNQVVTTNGAPRTIGVWTFNNNSGFEVSYGNTNSTFNFDNTSGNAALNVIGTTSVTSRITANLVLLDSLDLHVTNTAPTDVRGALALSGGVVSGEGRIIKTGAGTASLLGSNTYSGGVTINAGTIRITAASGLGALPGSPVANQVQINGGRLQFDGASNSASGTNRGFTFGPDNAEIAVTNTGVFSTTAAVVGTGALTKTGSGTFYLNPADGTLNTYSGGTVIKEGTLQVGRTSSLGTGPVTLGVVGAGDASLISSLAGYIYANNITVTANTGGTTTLGSDSTATFNTTFSGAITINGNLVVTTAAPSPQRLVFTGPVTGSGDITKVGTGEWRITGANSWSGNLEVSAGLANFFAGSQLRFTLGDGGLTNSVFGSGSATFDGTFVLDRSAVTAGTGTWNLVNVATLSESFGGSFTLRFLDETGSFTDAGGGLYTFGDWSFSTATGALSLAPVPEPSAFAALAGLGALGFASQRRRRR